MLGSRRFLEAKVLAKTPFGNHLSCKRSNIFNSRNTILWKVEENQRKNKKLIFVLLASWLTLNTNGFGSRQTHELVNRKNKEFTTRCHLCRFRDLYTLNSVLLAICYHRCCNDCEQVKAELIHIGHISFQDALLGSLAPACRGLLSYKHSLPG